MKTLQLKNARYICWKPALPTGKIQKMHLLHSHEAMLYPIHHAPHRSSPPFASTFDTIVVFSSLHVSSPQNPSVAHPLSFPMSRLPIHPCPRALPFISRLSYLQTVLSPDCPSSSSMVTLRHHPPNISWAMEQKALFRFQKDDVQEDIESLAVSLWFQIKNLVLFAHIRKKMEDRVQGRKQTSRGIMQAPTCIKWKSTSDPWMSFAQGHVTRDRNNQNALLSGDLGCRGLFLTV